MKEKRWLWIMAAALLAAAVLLWMFVLRPSGGTEKETALRLLLDGNRWGTKRISTPAGRICGFISR